MNQPFSFLTISFFFLIGIMPVATFAQSETDYLVLVNGEKLIGEFFESNDYLEKIDFKNKGTNGFKTYLPTEIKAAKISGNEYESISSDQVSPIIARVLAKGRIDLYEGIQNDNLKQFYIHKADSLVLLSQSTRLAFAKPDDERKSIIKSTEYLIPLKKALLDQPNFLPKADKIKFRLKAMKALIDDYNAIYPNDQDYEQIKTTNRLDLRHSLMFKTYLHELKPPLKYGLTYKHNYRSVGFAYLIAARFNEKAVLETGLEITLRSISIRPSLGEVSFSSPMITIPLHIHYYLGNKKLRPYFTGGFGLHVLMKEDINNKESFLTVENTVYDRNYLFSGSLGFGLEYDRKYFVQFFYFNPIYDYLTSRNLGLYRLVESQWTQYSVTLGYSF